MSVIENAPARKGSNSETTTRFWRQVPHSWEGVQYAVDRLLNGVIGAYQREPARCTKTAERNDTVSCIHCSIRRRGLGRVRLDLR